MASVPLYILRRCAVEHCVPVRLQTQFVHTWLRIPIQVRKKFEALKKSKEALQPDLDVADGVMPNTTFPQPVRCSHLLAGRIKPPDHITAVAMCHGPRGSGRTVSY